MHSDNLKNSAYRKPWVAALWSMFLPGFGQLYNRDFWVGFPMLLCEIFCNWAAKLNLSIFYFFNGNLKKSFEVMDFQWALFYPSFYAFSAWQAYNRATDINLILEEKGIPRPKKITHYDELFMGMLVGLNLGLQWGLLESPIFGTLLGGTIGAILGLFVIFLKK